jgi:hypothetical protein
MGVAPEAMIGSLQPIVGSKINSCQDCTRLNPLFDFNIPLPEPFSLVHDVIDDEYGVLKFVGKDADLMCHWWATVTIQYV